MLKDKNVIKNYKYIKLFDSVLTLANYYFNNKEKNKFLEKFAQNKINNYIDKINITLETSNKTLTKEEEEFLRMSYMYVINNLKTNINPTLEFKLLKSTNKIITNSISKDNKVDFFTFKLALKLNIEKCQKEIIAPYNKEYSARFFTADIIDFEMESFILHTNYDMYLDESLCKDLYNGNYFVLSTIFHELAHIQQFISIKKGLLNEETLIWIKERVIKEIDEKEKYYLDNYEFISYEIDAKIKGYIYMLRYLKSQGLELSNELEKNINEKINNELSKNKQELRKIDNIEKIDETLKLDSAFEKIIINHPEYLEKYPQLKIEFVNDNGKVRKKTIEELNETFEFYLSSNKYDIKKVSSFFIKILKKNEDKKNITKKIASL